MKRIIIWVSMEAVYRRCLIVELMLNTLVTFAQPHKYIKDYIVVQPDSLCINDNVNISLQTNQNDSIWLCIENPLLDTVFISNQIRESYFSKISYVIYNVSDSLLRSKTTRFNFSDCEFYKTIEYCDYSSDPDYTSYSYLKYRSGNTSKLTILPCSSVKLYIPHYFKNKCLFIRYYTVVELNKKKRFIQVDTNSIYLP